MKVFLQLIVALVLLSQFSACNDQSKKQAKRLQEQLEQAEREKKQEAEKRKLAEENRRLAEEKAAAEKRAADLLRQQAEAQKERERKERNKRMREHERTHYSYDEYKQWVEEMKMKKNKTVVGKTLLRATHPTGRFSSAPELALRTQSVSPLAPTKSITWHLLVYWRGGFTDTRYGTIYQYTLDKTKGVTEVSVVKDSALIKIDPAMLDVAKSALDRLLK